MNAGFAVVPLGEVIDLPLCEIEARLASGLRKPVRQVEIGELASLAAYPHGLYFFYEPGSGRLMYVGKSTSRSFTERIPAHFDPREAAWMNSLPKHVMSKESLSYADALERALSFEILLLGADSSAPIGSLEGIFRAFLQPYLNATNEKHDGATTLRQALSD
jgi:hypothetical protein